MNLNPPNNAINGMTMKHKELFEDFIIEIRKLQLKTANEINELMNGDPFNLTPEQLDQMVDLQGEIKDYDEILKRIPRGESPKLFTLDDVYEVLRQVMFTGTPELYDQGGLHSNYNLRPDHTLRRAKAAFRKYYLKEE